MRLAGTLLFLMVFPLLVCGQELIFLTTLQELIKGSSGLVYLDRKLITHNDSGEEPALYEIDTVSGDVISTVTISNATNVDWEDITIDSTYIYIGDFGNDGSRRDLKIYRIPISGYLTSADDTVTADIIQFSYSDQKDFTPSPFATNFDAEALIASDDSLYIFTKNWLNNWTNIYALPKTPGTYSIPKVDSINAQGLVTGATYDPGSNTVLLIGYTLVSPFIIEVSGFTFNEFSGGTIKRDVLPILPDYSIQMEGITSISQKQHYITAEEYSPLESALFRLNTDQTTGMGTPDESAGVIYPNPATGYLYIRHDDLLRVEFYDLQGVLHKISSSEQINVSDLEKGVYFVLIKSRGGAETVIKKLIIK